jgi:hypothetical protein
MNTIELQSIVFIFDIIEPDSVYGATAIWGFHMRTVESNGSRTHYRRMFSIFGALLLFSVIFYSLSSDAAPTQLAPPTTTAASSGAAPENLSHGPQNAQVPRPQTDTQFAGVGPAIKGIQLGLSDAQVRNTLLQNIRAIETGLPIAEHYRYSALPASNIQNLVDSYNQAAAKPYSVANVQALRSLAAEYAQKLGFNFADAQALVTRFNSGTWMAFYTPSGSVVLAVHYSERQNLVDWFQIDASMANKLFAAQNMSNREFAQAIADNYKIAKLNAGVSSSADVMVEGAAIEQGIDVDVVIPYSYESNDGWRIDIKGKTITVGQVAPQSQRFN